MTGSEQSLTALERFARQQGIPARPGAPLSAYTTFRIGGPAGLLCEPESEEQFVALLREIHRLNVRCYLLGNGSNVLFADEGFDGVVVRTAHALNRVVQDGESLVAGAGVLLTRVCAAARDAGLAGLEFAYGIPGTVGGAVYMNAGAYGGEMRDVLAAVRFLDETGQVRELPAEELALGYRTSVFESRPWCVLEARFALRAGDPAVIGAAMEDYMARRKAKQPLELPSAGSTFKRPVGAYAGALIDQCGLRGFRVGDAAISEKHCGFVVNLGQATCRDVLRLTDEVRRIVQEKTGFVLEKEIRVVR